MAREAVERALKGEVEAKTIVIHCLERKGEPDRYAVKVVPKEGKPFEKFFHGEHAEEETAKFVKELL